MIADALQIFHTIKDNKNNGNIYHQQPNVSSKVIYYAQPEPRFEVLQSNIPPREPRIESHFQPKLTLLNTTDKHLICINQDQIDVSFITTKIYICNNKKNVKNYCCVYNTAVRKKDCRRVSYSSIGPLLDAFVKSFPIVNIVISKKESG